MAVVKEFPIKRFNLTAAEELRRLADMAEKDPARFSGLILTYVSEDETRIGYSTHGKMLLSKQIGMLEMVKFDLLSI